MEETLARFHAQQEAAEHSGSDSGSGSEASSSDEERDGSAGGGLSDDALARLAEREELRLEDLTPEEQRAFLRAVGSGSIRRAQARCACAVCVAAR